MDSNGYPGIMDFNYRIYSSCSNLDDRPRVDDLEFSLIFTTGQLTEIYYSTFIEGRIIYSSLSLCLASSLQVGHSAGNRGK